MTDVLDSDTTQCADNAELMDTLRYLGGLLGETISDQNGQELFDCVEQVRRIAISNRRSQSGHSALLKYIEGLNLSSQAMHDLARAFSIFLNLANLAEQYHSLLDVRHQALEQQLDAPLNKQFKALLNKGVSKQVLFDTVISLRIEPVLTAHPTQVMRRSISAKYIRLYDLLKQRGLVTLLLSERTGIEEELVRVVHEIWETDEIRRSQPTPVDEARSGLVMVEQTLWDALPKVLEQLNQYLLVHTGKSLPLNCVPLRMCSWMGGDRDGNPNVTAAVTRRVLLVNRWKAAELFAKEISELRVELSMNQGNSALAEAAQNSHEPYRYVLKLLLVRLENTLRRIERTLDGQQAFTVDDSIVFTMDDLLQPLLLCFNALNDTDNARIASGRLSQLIRRVYSFGPTLLRLDIRQESTRHAQVMQAIVEALGLGDYLAWPEGQKIAFLLAELSNKRPLLPHHFSSSDDINEVIATFRVIAEEPFDSFGAYVISMATHASDILAVEVLQKACGVKRPLRVVPLFERLQDLKGAVQVMNTLWSNAYYSAYIKQRQEVMVGYSDSAKDAGQLSASWALYEAQEQLAESALAHNISLTLFHGRGGTVARGGVPAHTAIRAQPPGSVNASIRVTEQGEVIQAKYGLPDLAEDSLNVYLCAVLEATLAPQDPPKQVWRDVMQQLSESAVQGYRSVVVEEPDFVPYFIQATPERELGGLKIGSRPARRKQGEGITYLRAIPWIFAWTQTRLHLPAWLGINDALSAAAPEQALLIQEMYSEWVYFKSFINAIEMVLAKADTDLAGLYDQHLVDAELLPLGDNLRACYDALVIQILAITGNDELVAHEPELARALKIRNPYVDPINCLQVLLLKRIRGGESGKIDDALIVAINGISAGMRNTG